MTAPATRDRRPDCVAVFNSSDDVIELLRMVIEQAGFAVVTGHIDDIKRGKLDLQTFVSQHDPKVIVYDVAPPYDRTWLFLEHLRSQQPLQGRQFVLTTTNLARVREAVGPAENIYEIVGKPFDLDVIVRAVKEASRARATR
jgi:response regulator RpfG family c-di-GMP phosphodiesterase